MPRSPLAPLPRRAPSLGLVYLAVAGALVVATSCTRAPTVRGDVAIVGVTLIDGTDRPAATNQTVIIAGDSIVAVGPASSMTPETATTVDGNGKWLMPGLWDMHAHLYGYGAAAFPLFIANGVTSIRDVGGGLKESLDLRAATNERRVLGPTMLISGPVLDSEYVLRSVQGTPLAPGRVPANDSASAAHLVDSLADAHVDFIKVHALISPNAYEGLMLEARKRGMDVGGHVPDPIMPSDAIDAGQRTIEHDSELELEESPQGRAIHTWMYEHMKPVIRAHRAHPVIGPIFAYRLLAADSAMATFDSATAAAFAQRVAKLPVWFDPTLVVLEAVFRGREPGALDTTNLKYAPASIRAFNDGSSSDKPPTEAELALGRKRWRNALEALHPLIVGGAKIVTGTDIPESPLVPGFSVHRELRNLVEAGMTPRQAIQAGSRNAADATRRLPRSGTIEHGKVADMILLDRDPLANIANTTAIRAVVTRGRVLDRATLDKMLRDAETYAKTH